MSESTEPKAAASVQPTGNASPGAGSPENRGEGPQERAPRGEGDQQRRGPHGGGGPGGNRGPRRDRDDRGPSDGLTEKVVFINRCAKVVKGGRRFSFSALIVVGDQQGKVGIGFGKANEVADAIRKAGSDARANIVTFNMDGTTISHEVIAEHGGGRVLLRPASAGTGIIAGGGMRAVLEVSGIRDVLAKNMGSNNHSNVVKATVKALQSLRTRDEIYTARGKKIAEKQAL